MLNLPFFVSIKLFSVSPFISMTARFLSLTYYVTILCFATLHLKWDQRLNSSLRALTFALIPTDKIAVEVTFVVTTGY